MFRCLALELGDQRTDGFRNHFKINTSAYFSLSLSPQSISCRHRRFTSVNMRRAEQPRGSLGFSHYPKGVSWWGRTTTQPGQQVDEARPGATVSTWAPQHGEGIASEIAKKSDHRLTGTIGSLTTVSKKRCTRCHNWWIWVSLCMLVFNELIQLHLLLYRLTNLRIFT